MSDGAISEVNRLRDELDRARADTAAILCDSIGAGQAALNEQLGNVSREVDFWW